LGKKTNSGAGGGGSSNGSSGLLGSFRGGGGFAAALGLGRNSRSFADQFRSHDAGDEELGTVVIKIDGRPFLIGRSDNSESVYLMLDGLTFLHYLHRILLGTFSGDFLERTLRSHSLNGTTVQNFKNSCLEKNQLESSYVLCLKALWAFLNFELHGLPFVQRFIAFHGDRGKVHEYIFSRLPLDKAETL